MNAEDVEVVVIGGGQAGLAAGYYLRRAGHRFVILDDQPTPGGAWPHTWASLTLFSPAQYSSLPGWPMPNWPNGFPPAHHVVDYLRGYEQRYEIPVRRPVHVDGPTTSNAPTSSCGRPVSGPHWPICGLCICVNRTARSPLTAPGRSRNRPCI